MMEIEKLKPVHKEGNKRDLNNYRPISNKFAKILEKVILKQIADFINKHKLIYKGQHGFWQKVSTKTATTEAIPLIKTTTDPRRNAAALLNVKLMMCLCNKAIDKFKHTKNSSDGVFYKTMYNFTKKKAVTKKRKAY